MKTRLQIVVVALLLLLGVTAGVAEAQWEEGVAAFKAGNYTEAVQQFRQVVEAQPEFDGGVFMLAQALDRAGQESEALANYRKAYELKPDSVSYQFALGGAYLANDRYNEAAQMLEKIDPASLPKAQQATYRQMLAVALAKSGDSGRALAALKEAAEANPTSASAWFAYGTSAYNADEIGAAITALERAVELDGDDPRKLDTLLKAKIAQARRTRDRDQKKARYAAVVPLAGRLAQRDPSHDNLLTLGEVQLGARQYADAASNLEKAAAKNGSDFFAPYYAAQAYTSTGNWARAEANAEKALQLANSNQDKQRVWRQIGFLNEKMKNYDEALAAYRKAGDAQSVARIEENLRIAEENQEIDEHNRRVEALEREQAEVERELEELGGPPPRYQ